MSDKLYAEPLLMYIDKDPECVKSSWRSLTATVKSFLVPSYKMTLYAIVE